MTHFTLTVPVTFRANGETRTRYPRVGALFQNFRRETGEAYFTVKLDFPVGATEILAFAPEARGARTARWPDGRLDHQGGMAASVRRARGPRRGSTGLDQEEAVSSDCAPRDDLQPPAARPMAGGAETPSRHPERPMPSSECSTGSALAKVEAVGGGEPLLAGRAGRPIQTPSCPRKIS